MASMKKPRPFVKWVGSKRDIADMLYELAPNNFEQYWEPFAGGAAFFFKLAREEKIDAACLSDINEQLMITTYCIAERVDEVIELLNSDSFANDEELYYEIRAWDRTDEWETMLKDEEQWPLVAARTIYLTKLAWRGLWRVNKKGQHNAPYWKAYTDRKNLFEEANLRAVSRALKGIHLIKANFHYIQSENWNFLAQMYNPPCPNDFFYFDPPYVESFTDYTKDGFGIEELHRLRFIADSLTHLGCYVMISMADIEGIDVLFNGYHIIRFKTRCKTTNSKKMNEVVILNYDPDTKEKRSYEFVSKYAHWKLSPETFFIW